MKFFISRCFASAALILIGIRVIGGQSAPTRELIFAEVGEFHIPSVRRRSPQPGTLPQQVFAKGYSVAYARRELVAGIGGGIASGDVDGRHYVYVAARGWNALLQDNGGGRFEDVTEQTGIAVRQSVLSATFVDYDRSGHVSLWLATAGGVVLYRSRGDGTFTDYTRRAGLPGSSTEVCTRAILSDFDGDGFPDLVLTMYTDLARPPSMSEFTFPDDFAGAETRIYRNDGKGGFQDVTVLWGLSGNRGRARTAIVADFNGDQHSDLLILRDDRPPALFCNRGDGRLTETTWQAGNELTGHAFFDGAVADFNHDGVPHLALWSAVSFRVLLNDGKGHFKDAPLPRIAPNPMAFGFHGTVGDFDADGFPDLLTADAAGGWHLLHNQHGSLSEIPFSIKTRSPGGNGGLQVESATVSGGRGGPYLWTVGTRAQVTVFRR